MLIKVTDFHNFLHLCQEKKFDGYKKVFIPAESSVRKEEISIELLHENSKIVLDRFRAQDPFKTLFYRFRESVSGGNFSDDKYIVAGIKACDFHAIELLDKALINEDFYDPAYKYWRENTLLITCDCNEIKNSCHCSLVNGKPYVDKGYDINLIPIDDHYIIQIGSVKGQSLADNIDSSLLSDESDSEVELKISAQRNKITDQLKSQNNTYNRPENFNKLLTSVGNGWDPESASCIGCGACTNICPTCYCLILNDESTKNYFLKERSYDSCQLNGYARVAGGASPRPKMTERFRNRYLCKFCYMHSNFEILGCTGCGRCIDACPAQIDFREVVSKINNESIDHLDKTEKQHV